MYTAVHADVSAAEEGVPVPSKPLLAQEQNNK